MSVADIEYDLMNFCLKYKGRWWSNHFFYNKEVKELYRKLRALDLGAVIAILGNGGPTYQRQIEIYERIVKPIMKHNDQANDKIN